MKRALKWSSNIVTVILGIFLIVTMYCAVSSRISGGTPKIFGHDMYEVLSGSMEPGIHTGSVIFDKPNVDVNKLKVGDVVTFKAPDNEFGADKMIITHRILTVQKQDGQLAFQTKGDANDSPDSKLVPAANVIAQYDNITIPYVGYYLNFMKTKLGVGLLLILPGGLLILTTMISLFREISKLSKGEKKEAESVAATSSAESTNV